MFSEAPVVLRVPCFAPELYVRADIERKPAEKKDTYVPQHPPGTRAFRGARACTLSCALPLSQPCATCAHTYPDAGVYVRTYVRTSVSACERTCV